MDKYVTDKNGQFTTKEYVCDNDWTIREITPSEGYLLDTTIHKVGAEPQLYTVEHNQTANDVNEQVTQINYPVMQSPQEPNFYLKHGFDKEYTDYGCPYMSESCDVNKPSDNLIVYGHHMKNGTMFSDLEKFKSKDFWEEHKTFRFDTLYVKQTYEIIAVFKTAVYTGSENEFKYYQFVDAAVQEQFDGYIQRAKEKAFYDTGVSADYGDKLITLSTCEYSGQNSRLVVVAKKVTESGGSNAPSNDGATEIQS